MIGVAYFRAEEGGAGNGFARIEDAVVVIIYRIAEGIFRIVDVDDVIPGVFADGDFAAFGRNGIELVAGDVLIGIADFRTKEGGAGNGFCFIKNAVVIVIHGIAEGVLHVVDADDVIFGVFANGDAAAFGRNGIELVAGKALIGIADFRTKESRAGNGFCFIKDTVVIVIYGVAEGILHIVDVDDVIGVVSAEGKRTTGRIRGKKLVAGEIFIGITDSRAEYTGAAVRLGGVDPAVIIIIDLIGIAGEGDFLYKQGAKELLGNSLPAFEGNLRKGECGTEPSIKRLIRAAHRSGNGAVCIRSQGREGNPGSLRAAVIQNQIHRAVYGSRALHGERQKGFSCDGRGRCDARAGTGICIIADLQGFFIAGSRVVDDIGRGGGNRPHHILRVVITGIRAVQRFGRADHGEAAVFSHIIVAAGGAVAERIEIGAVVESDGIQINGAAGISAVELDLHALDAAGIDAFERKRVGFEFALDIPACIDRTDAVITCGISGGRKPVGKAAPADQSSVEVELEGHLGGKVRLGSHHGEEEMARAGALAVSAALSPNGVASVLRRAGSGGIIDLQVTAGNNVSIRSGNELLAAGQRLGPDVRIKGVVLRRGAEKDDALRIRRSTDDRDHYRRKDHEQRQQGNGKRFELGTKFPAHLYYLHFKKYMEHDKCAWVVLFRMPRSASGPAAVSPKIRGRDKMDLLRVRRRKQKG